ncbi:hypothetical protein BCD67_09770 [Oscillatoriales cyanobacterium USR001]|nr:hypothetical protein BCD67_09770 [Oscillatoriales cyanobacterium USR001]
MTKVVFLKPDGNMETGFRVSVEILNEGGREREIRGNLPPNPELADAMNKHWEKYRDLDIPKRIKPKSIKHNSSPIDEIKSVYKSGENLKLLTNQWLKSEGFRDIDIGLREELKPSEKVRVLIQTEDDYLRKLPWHSWDFVQRYHLAEVAISPVEYKKPKPKPSPTIVAKPQVRILAILGCSTNIDVEKDKELLEKLPNAKVVFLDQPKRHQINDKLWEQSWDIIFFAGHGETEKDDKDVEPKDVERKDVGRIHINKTDSLTLAEVWYGLKKAVENGLQLAIFNSCDGLGLARCLDDLEIPQMIVMREMVPDFVAQQFLKDFLNNFAGGTSLYQAFRDAREKLQGLETNFPCASWLPIICQNPAVEPPIWANLRGTDNLPIQEIFSEPPVENHPIPLNGISQLFRRITKGNYKLKLAALLLLTCGVVGWQYASPKLAVAANNIGFDRFQKGDLVNARQFLGLASILNPYNRVIPYTLGWICQDLNDINCARKNYEHSVELGFPNAYTQLARLYIVHYKNYGTAVNLLLQGLPLVKVGDDTTMYSFQKNLGWARLEQGRYGEALERLETAIKLDSKRAPAYCLKAQVLEGMKDPKAALKEWQSCLKYADSQDADEDRWIGMGKERLNSK